MADCAAASFHAAILCALGASKVLIWNDGPCAALAMRPEFQLVFEEELLSITEYS